MAKKNMQLTITYPNVDEIQEISDELRVISERGGKSKEIIERFVNDFLDDRMVKKELFDIDIIPTSTAGDFDCIIKGSNVLHSFVLAVRARDWDSATVIHEKLLC